MKTLCARQREKKNQDTKKEAATGPGKEGTRPREVETVPGTRPKLGKSQSPPEQAAVNRTWKCQLEWGGSGKMARASLRQKKYRSQDTQQIN